MIQKKPVEFSNEFLEYYGQIQQIFSDESEWERFLAKFREDLPSAFRLTATGQILPILTEVLKQVFVACPDLQTVRVSEDLTLSVPPVAPTSWYPNPELVWSYAINRGGLRRLPALKKFKTFMAVENDAGHLTAQELVSMVPSLLLKVSPSSRVLDMCAAPGSKTGQLLELMHASARAQNCDATGIVVANDLDVKRAYLLINRIVPLASANILVLNYPAQLIPTITNKDGSPLLYSGVLCDVPCSGDGTIRKANHIAKTWNNTGALQLHSLQIAIAKRGIQLLEVGGLMVYSTCSMNPLEDESVVAELLRSSDGCMELVDTSSELPTLVRANGLRTWGVWDSRVGVVTEASNTYPQSMFPPTKEELEVFHLERCMRLYPHHNNTGAFFVALLRKVRAMGTEGAAAGTELGDNPEPESTSEFKELPYRPLSQQLHPLVERTFTAFGMESPISIERLFVREDGGVRLTIASSTIADILLQSHLSSTKLRIVSAGAHVLMQEQYTQSQLKLFAEKGEERSKLRLTSTGVSYIFPYMTRQIVRITLPTLQLLLRVTEPIFFHGKRAEQRVLPPNVVEQLEATGSIVFVLTDTPSETDSSLDRVRKASQLVFPGWRGAVSTSLHVNKMEMLSLRYLFLGDNYTLENSASEPSNMEIHE